MKLVTFPVAKRFDKQTGRYSKQPAIKEDWRTYRGGVPKGSKNFGVVIPDGVLLIDVDHQKGVSLSDIDDVLECALNWDGALVQYTVSGGAHYAFNVPAGVKFQQGSNILDVQGFDTRCSGRGWICTGEGYDDNTVIGLPDALVLEPWPELPESAVTALSGGSVGGSSPDGVNGLAEAVAKADKVEGLTAKDALIYLEQLPTGDVDQYDTWVKVGMSLHHQFDGGAGGFKVWRRWSKQSQHYDLDELKAKWRSFGRSSQSNPTTFAYVVQRAGGRVALSQRKFETLVERAGNINNFTDYEAFKSEVQAMDERALPSDLRGMVAASVAATWGKVAGLTKAEIKKGLTLQRHAQVSNGAPDWLSAWVYVEVDCKFANTNHHYSIKREAFNAKYDRKAECIGAGKPAAQYALVECAIPTVVNKMFWPGKEPVFEHNGLDMLNAYHTSGVTPADTIDEDGRRAINLFLDHVKFTLSDEKEQLMLLDWLTFVIQHPGKRINWALLLQGCQGSGKSYFVHMMQQVMGEHVRNLDPTAITGRFTGWAHGAVMIAVEEIRITGTNRYEVLDRLKPFLTNPTVMIEEKGDDHRTVPNFTSYMMLTNHKDAIPLTDGDRRYGVLFSRVQTEGQLYKELGGKYGVKSYFQELFDATDAHADALARWFLDRRISKDFDAAGRAPETAARKKMTDSAVSPERMLVEDAIAENECAIVNEDIVDMTWLNELTMGEMPKTRAVSAIMLELGYEQVEGRRVKIAKDKRNHYIWRSIDVTDEFAIETVREFFKESEFIPD